ncbi:MAG: hypothetical protein WB952_19435 [Terriglobales bacterium]
MSVVSSAQGELAHFSPERTQFVVVTHKGNLTNNTTEYCLILFKSKEVFQSPKPENILTLASSSSLPAIGDLRWLDDETIMFIGTEGASQTSQIFSFNLRTRKATRVSKSEASVVAFDTAGHSTVAFLASPPPGSFLGGQAAERGLVVSTQQVADLLSDRNQGSNKLFVQGEGGDLKQVSLNETDLLPSVSLSPEGHHLIVEEQIPADSNLWNKYGIAPEIRLLHYLVVDPNSGLVSPLIEAPALPSQRPDVAWSLDGISVVVTATYLPLGGVGVPVGRNDRPDLFTVEVNLKTRKIRTIYEGLADLVQWNPQTSTIVLQARSIFGENKDGAMAFQKRGDTWAPTIVPHSATEAPGRTFSVEEKQDMNTPPRLVVIDEATKQETMLLDPNPQFHNLEFGRVEEISWKGTDGRDSKGGLYLPPSYVAGRRYPFVVQLEGWDSHKFWMDGPSTAGYAAQELAARDIVVAQVGLPSRESLTTTTEGPAAMSSIEGLIDFLDRLGLIDRRLIGLLGWGRTGYHVRYTLAFSKYPIAAAVIPDGMDASYVQYMSWLNTDVNAGYTYERINGGRPFGSGLGLWLQHATGFSLERVHTPVWLLGFRRYSLLNNWEWFSGLRRLGKPVELTWLPDAEHSPVKPAERLTAQGGTVDWFVFWLKGEEDSDPAKAEQYARWRNLRELHERDIQAKREQETRRSTEK